MKTYCLVFSNPLEGKEEEYNNWYTGTHMREMLQVKGFESAQRFKLTEEQLIREQPNRYLAIYEIDGSDVAGTLERLADAYSSMHMAPVIDSKSTKVSIFQSITDSVE